MLMLRLLFSCVAIDDYLPFHDFHAASPADAPLRVAV